MKYDQQNKPPEELDGAKVIKWAWSGNRPFGFITLIKSESDDSIEIYGLAICQYRDSDNVYRFSCDRNWEVQQDALYESAEEALSKLPEQYKLVVANWQTK